MLPTIQNIALLSYSPCLASGSGSEEEDEEDEEEESCNQSEGEEEEGEDDSVSGSGRSEHSAGKTVKGCPHISVSCLAQHDSFNTVVSSISEDVSEEEQSDDDFEEERENGNHIPAGG